MHFNMKNYLKSIHNHNHTAKQTQNVKAVVIDLIWRAHAGVVIRFEGRLYTVLAVFWCLVAFDNFL